MKKFYIVVIVIIILLTGGVILAALLGFFMPKVPVVVHDCLNYNIGDDYGGGKLAWCGEYNGRWKALIAAASDQSYDVEWGCYSPYQSDIFGTNPGLFTGVDNTSKILDWCHQRPIAASIAEDYDGEGYTDWYLPSKEELYILYINRDKIGGFATDSDQIHPSKGRPVLYDYWIGSYWSSTEVVIDGVGGRNMSHAWAMIFSDNAEMNILQKFYTGRVRAVRSIAQR